MSSRGFTLIETAIVMLMAGLLVGGVLKGQEIVTQARSKQLVADLTSVQAALLTYRDRYGAIPGDDRQAATRWATAGAKAGDGDGAVNGRYNDRLPGGAQPTTLTVDSTSGESQNFWWHLRLSGFVLGPMSGAGAADLPMHAANGIIGVQSGEPTKPGFIPSLMACASNVPGRIAVAVDAEIDDLRPGGGRVQSLLQASGSDSPTLQAAAVTANYAEDGASRYVVCRALE